MLIKNENLLVSQSGSYLYCVGIVDTLTSFNLKKKGEFFFKTIF